MRGHFFSYDLLGQGWGLAWGLCVGCRLSYKFSKVRLNKASPQSS